MITLFSRTIQIFVRRSGFYLPTPTFTKKFIAFRFPGKFWFIKLDLWRISVTVWWRKFNVFRKEFDKNSWKDIETTRNHVLKILSRIDYHFFLLFFQFFNSGNISRYFPSLFNAELFNAEIFFSNESR